MSNRLNPLVRLACFLLAALVFYQFSRIILKRNDFNSPAMAMIHATGGTAPSQAHGSNFSPVRIAAKDSALPPGIKEQIDKITQSEILGQVMRPLPMALLGIAGPDILLRTPNGQTGLLRQGEELGGIKLLQIGTNRVLIEQDGKKKELMIFSGFGSQTLLPKEKDQAK